MVATWPGTVMEMTPAHMHMHLDVSLSAGIPPIMTLGDPGAHGVVVFGTQGIGVRTPRAADVAAATVGLARLVHAPNVGMFTIGL